METKNNISALVATHEQDPSAVSAKRIYDILEKKDYSTDILDDLDILIRLGRILDREESIKELYLTECRYCCSGIPEKSIEYLNNSSYRLFDAVPYFDGQHPDSCGRNLDILLVKTYNQQSNVALELAKLIAIPPSEISERSFQNILGDVPSRIIRKVDIFSRLDEFVPICYKIK